MRVLTAVRYRFGVVRRDRNTDPRTPRGPPRRQRSTIANRRPDRMIGVRRSDPKASTLGGSLRPAGRLTTPGNRHRRIRKNYLKGYEVGATMCAGDAMQHRPTPDRPHAPNTHVRLIMRRYESQICCSLKTQPRPHHERMLENVRRLESLPKRPTPARVPARPLRPQPAAHQS